MRTSKHLTGAMWSTWKQLWVKLYYSSKFRETGIEMNMEPSAMQSKFSFYISSIYNFKRCSETTVYVFYVFLFIAVFLLMLYCYTDFGVLFS